MSKPVLRGPQSSNDFCSYNVDSCSGLGHHRVDRGPSQTGLDTPALPHPSLCFWLTLCWLLSSFSLSENREWYQDFSNLHKTELLWDGTEDMKNRPFLLSYETSVKRLQTEIQYLKKRNLWIVFKVLKHNMCIFCPMNTDRKKFVNEESTRKLWLHFRLNSFFKVKLVYTSAAVFSLDTCILKKLSVFLSSSSC